MDPRSPNRGKTPVQVDPNFTPKQFRWTYEMEAQFLDMLMHEDRLGNRVGGTFTPQAYRNILGDLQGIFGIGIQKNHLRNKIRTMKQQYSEFKDAFRGMSGFSWNWETKKFEAEDEVWESLIQDNPSAACLRGKTCVHWDKMNTLWSSSRAVGNTASTFRERCTRLDARFTEMSYEAPYQATTQTGSGNIPDVAGSPRRTYGTSNDVMPDVSGSRPSASSSKSRGKRKSLEDALSEAVSNNMAECVKDLSRAMVESAERIASKVPRRYQDSADLFNALASLNLPKDYQLDAYEHMSNHENDANMFLGSSEQLRAEILDRIMRRR